MPTDDFDRACDRKMFAAFAMQGLLAGNPLDKEGEIDPGALARDAVACADALMKELALVPMPAEPQT